MATQVWDMKDLGLQATAHIVSAVEAQRDPLARLAAVSGNFPALARWLSKQPVDAALRDEVGHNHRTVGAQEEAILVNGRVLDTASPSFNVFQLLKDLGEETPLIVRGDGTTLQAGVCCAWGVAHVFALWCPACGVRACRRRSTACRWTRGPRRSCEPCLRPVT